ncbi:hypothetical protein DFH29DRAFT_817140 [Suillus ampliporus]|nr:hypothetical protein DFH29DRAFT_817140 [Suillus ampliporus]
MHKIFGRPRFRAPSPSRQPQNSNLPDFELSSHGLCYLSDESDNGTESDGDDSDGDQPAVPPLKRRKLDVPYREQRRLAKETRLDEMKKALTSIEKLLKAKKTVFVGGLNGLQVKCARSIQSYLTMVIKMKRLSIDASQRAAESHGFAANWGGRQVCSWTRLWVADCKLPESLQGQHAKVYSLLGDPTIATELRTYVRSNKWVVNPEKLIQLSQDKLIPAEATKYTQNLVEEEMPWGLKKYMELEIFPHNHLKVGRGISLSTAHQWLRCEGFLGQYWVFEDEFRLRKKGAGRGFHRSCYKSAGALLIFLLSHDRLPRLLISYQYSHDKVS